MEADTPTGRKELLVIGGATATGKTAMAIRLARQLDAEILSADSRQFYREMSIGTAKPSAEELAAAPHHFINSLSVADDYSVGDFERDALNLLTQIFAKKDRAILVGGSGLYLRAVCEGIDRFPDVPPAVREQVNEGYAHGGLLWLQAQVAALDPVQFAAMDQQNPARLRRTLEVCLATGQPYSAFLRHEKKLRFFQPVYLLLEYPRDVLYARIEARVDAMIEAGLEDEAHSLLPWRERPALRTVGYEEWFDCFDGKCSREATIDKIKQHTRNYAKRQATWFRKYGEWRTIGQGEMADYPYQ